MHGASSSVFLLAFSLTDNRADPAEVALVAGVAFVGAYFVSNIAARVVRWAAGLALGTAETAHLRQSARRPVLVVRIVTFLLVWALLALPLLTALGLPFGFGMERGAIRVWLLASGIRIVTIIVVAWLVLRVALLATDRLSRELSAGEGVDVIERTKRAQTLGRLVHNVLAVLISSMALLMVLRELGVDIVPMLTGAGIAGVALGFGAQWLVRDVIAGFYLILDNQVRVGDVAAINGVGGVVEAINLRTIVLRDAEGTVHVFQNGAINTLSNRTKDFSFYVIDLNIAYGQDPDRVVALARGVGEELRADPTYQSHILAPLEIFGVDAFLDSKITIKLRIKTLPQKQWEVGRELRRRLLLALEHGGISLAPTPTRTVVLEPKEEAEVRSRT
jgi:small conductance mechanosensitive channel